ncbi:MAG: proline dehydrogenase family protein, partial [Planctomycetes bacterium]|nr:proline dehydrogenase family protein [Planctomycetota bacterium]
MIDLEARTHDYGREIFARLGGANPVLLGPRWWDDRLLEWTMDNEAVKVQLFRFIDVLPFLDSSAAITRHLREYFQEAGPALPGWLRRALPWVPRDGLAAKLLAATARHNAQRLARRFIAGETIQEALHSIARLRRHSLAFTVDLLGEATLTEVEAERYQAEYLNLIAGLSRSVNAWPTVPLIDQDQRGPLPRVNVSIKLSSLYSQFDPIDPEGTSRAVRARLRPILKAARRHRVFVNVDMEQYAYKDLTLRIFREVLDEDEFRDWPDAGIAIQAYLPESTADLEQLARWAERRGTSVWIRLIKGAYWDYETVVAAQQNWPVPVFTHKSATDAHYERLTRFLLQHQALLRPAFGSHNVRSLAHALAVADELGLPPRCFEVQMLYGMAEPLQEALVSLGQRVRIYTPFGQLLPGMAYLVRRLLENTSNESFLRARFTEHVPEEELLMNPLDKKTPALQAAARPLPENGPPALPPFQNEPLTDFSRDEARRAMSQALEQTATQLGRQYLPVIAGREVAAESFFDSLNPAHSRQVVGRCARSTAAQAEQAVAAAVAAFPGWRDTSPRERADYLVRAAQVLRRRRLELAAWEVYECGKQWREADADVAESIDYCEYYAREMLRLAGPVRWDLPGEENLHLYEPRGVTVVIAPWNFPLAILCGMSTAALVTGNPIIMKPAEQSSVI